MPPRCGWGRHWCCSSAIRNRARAACPCIWPPPAIAFSAMTVFSWTSRLNLWRACASAWRRRSACRCRPRWARFSPVSSPARTRREMAGQAYLSLAEGSAGFGEGSPVGALVLADRRDGAETSLAPAGRGDLRPVAIGMPVHRNEAGVPVVRRILWRIRCIVNHVWSGPGQARTPESQRWGSRPRADGVAKCIAKRN
jgi:hypothetical protein